MSITKIEVVIEGETETRSACLPDPGAYFAEAEGECPECRAHPFEVQGITGTMVEGRDTYTSKAKCLACEKTIGKIVAHVSTIFGIAADREMLSNSRCRVY